MSLRSQFYRHIVYPLALRVRGEHATFEVQRMLEDLQWKSQDQLRAYQERKLAEILRYAAEKVPWYQDSALDPECRDDRLLSIFSELPYLTKRSIQENREAFMARGVGGRIAEKTTGGSTWEPVTIRKDSGAIAHERAATWLAYGWFGVQMGDRGARFWGLQTSSGWTRLKQRVTSIATNRVRFSAFKFTDEDLERYWNRCVSIRPDYFYGYRSMLTEFARFVDRQGYDGSRLGLKAVISTAEALADPHRKLLRRTFDAPVQNEYGCGEVGPIAYQCPNGSMHTMSDNVFVEVLDENGRSVEPGETGWVCVTDLNNKAMPLIRYRVGDMAVRGNQCECGRGFSVLRRVWGREDDFIEDISGRRFHGEYFIHLLEELPELDQKVGKVRVVQRTKSSITIEVERGGGLSEEERSQITREIEEDMVGMSVSIKDVGTIPRLDSGKTRVIDNKWLRESE